MEYEPFSVFGHIGKGRQREWQRIDRSHPGKFISFFFTLFFFLTLPLWTFYSPCQHVSKCSSQLISERSDAARDRQIGAALWEPWLMGYERGGVGMRGDRAAMFKCLNCSPDCLPCSTSLRHIALTVRDASMAVFRQTSMRICGNVYELFRQRVWLRCSFNHYESNDDKCWNASLDWETSLLLGDVVNKLLIHNQICPSCFV